MAFSQNPFSVASFGESYEQADLTVTLTGVQGTTTVNGDGVDARSIVTVPLTGVQADGSIDDVTVEAKAVFTLDSVSATGTIDSPTIVEGTGVVFTSASVSATGSVNDDLNIIAKAVVVPDGTQSTFTLANPTIVEGVGVTFTLDSVSSTINVNTVTVIAPADVPIVGVIGTFTVGEETVTAVQFDYEAVKENYSRHRTQYIEAPANKITAKSSVKEMPRAIYVATTSETRTVYVAAGESRTVYISPDNKDRRAKAA